ncbi:hypothetical protein SRHO_G00086180 [Serrasalmus rhombeus]
MDSSLSVRRSTSTKRKTLVFKEAGHKPSVCGFLFLEVVEQDSLVLSYSSFAVWRLAFRSFYVSDSGAAQLLTPKLIYGSQDECWS